MSTIPPINANPGMPALTALQRVQQSRERMRRYLLPAAKESGAADEGGVKAKLGGWVEGLRGHPVAGAVIDAVLNWWSTHPLRSVAELGEAAAEEFAVPWIRKHPMACVAGAVVAGVLVSKLRPWRWVIRPALFAGLTSQVVARLVSEAPLDFLVTTLNRFGNKPPPMDDPSSANAQSPATDEAPEASAPL